MKSSKSNSNNVLVNSSNHDLFMYSHDEGQPLIRKLAPFHSKSSSSATMRTPSASNNKLTRYCCTSTWNTIVGGGLLLFLLLLVAPPLPWFINHTQRNTHRPFQESLQQHMTTKSTTSTTTSTTTHLHTTKDPMVDSDQQQQHHQSGCRQIVPAKVTTRTDLPGFSSYWNYAGSPMNVTYDERSLLINGDRTLFLSGSMHPVRATRDTWNLACDEAVRNGLNMITIYIFWSAHQPFSADQPLDWSLFGNTLDCQNNNNNIDNIEHSNIEHTNDASSARDDVNESSSTTQAEAAATTDSSSTTTTTITDCTCRWDLATAIRAAASRGLWVHVRLGPYDCAEYNYGGIPAWLPLQKPHMAMRRYDPDWLQAMQDFVTSAVTFLRNEQLWAYQGGPIILAQIENELGENKEEKEEEDKDRRRHHHHNKNKNGTTVQDYANWCGDLATRLEPDVIWTMCNGLSAPQTISTCNGLIGDNSCSTTWLEDYGDSGVIQKKQPAFWTEAEQGFQIWGETPQHPSDYFWGTTSREMAHDALRWFARGGSSLNWYMWWGGYNRGRAAAAGITNTYASDAPLCPSGQRRHPKFGHMQALHETIADVASLLLDAPSALFLSKPIEYMNPQGRWEVGDSQRVFVYRQQQQQQEKHKTHDTPWREVHFVENDSRFSTVVRFPVQSLGVVKVLAMEPQSSALVVDGILRFDSAAVNPRSMSYNRVVEKNSAMILDWQQWMEPRTATLWNNNSYDRSLRSVEPIEQTNLTVTAQIDSDYVWYETNLTLYDDVRNSSLWIDTQKANAFTVFMDDELVGTADNHQHAEGNITFSFPLGHLKAGEHRVAILSESLGYFNLVGRWGASTRPKTKGITGDVVLTGLHRGNKTMHQSLLDGRDWLSFAGLHGERPGRWMQVGRADLDAVMERGGSLGSPCSWSSALFDTPTYDPISQALFVEITTGRGHLWLNGRDLGRFWNITREGTDEYSQPYYLLPYDFLYTDGKLNELLFFNALDGDLRKNTDLVMSWLQESDKPHFLDEDDFPLACI